MMKYFIGTLLLLCMTTAASAQTYYYERVSRTVDNRTTPDQGDGHFITITKQSCYDSKRDGISIGGAFFDVLLYKGVQNGCNKYVGNGYFGHSIYLFANNYQDLTIKVIDLNLQLHYKKRIAPQGVESAHFLVTQAVEGLINNVQAPNPRMSGVSSSSLGSNGTSTKSRCSGCGGTGVCTSCRGMGLMKSYASYTDQHTIISKCPVCHGSGRCGVCHGKGVL